MTEYLFDPEGEVAAIDRCGPGDWMLRPTINKNESQKRERGELLRVIAVAIRHGLRFVATVDDPSVLDGEFDPERFCAVRMPPLGARDVQALWNDWTAAPIPAVGARIPETSLRSEVDGG